MITAAKLMDRLLWNQYYMVPNWYINTHRIAYYDKFEMPKTFHFIIKQLIMFFKPGRLNDYIHI